MQRYRLPVVLGLIFAACQGRALAQFSFNGGSAGSVVSSIANQTCGAGSTGGGMMGGGVCDGTPFLQEVTNIGGNQYYHIVIGGSGFGIEYYVRTVAGTVCWYGCADARAGAGMGGMMGGGVAPLSSSAGAGGLSGNNTNPLASSNNGVGRPDRAAIRMFNNTTGLTQEFLKSTEANKPRITQTVSDQTTTVNFTMDMSNSNYSDSSRAGNMTLRQTVNDPDLPGAQTNPETGAALPRSDVFDYSQVSGPGVERDITGGRFRYTAGSGDGGSLGTYSYFADSFNVYAVDWASYCDPAQNPASGCTNYGGTAGGMMGGGGSSGGTTTTVASTTTTTSGGSGGGSMGGSSSGGGTTTSTVSSTTTTSTTTTTSSGGGMGGGM